MRILWAFIVAALAPAHPMGNFSINQYTCLRPAGDRVLATYIVDLAESPAYEMQSTGVPPVLDWVRRLRFISHGQVLAPRIENRHIDIQPGSGGLSTLRVTVELSLEAPAHQLDFEDTNFPGTPGWKEIVIEPGPGTAIVRASHSAAVRSKGLTDYRGHPPYDLRAAVSWRPGSGEGVIEPIAQPVPPSTQQSTAAWPLARSDFLSTLLSKRDLSIAATLAGLAAALFLGALHALSPGHGKTVVAAYLAGSRGTMKHAALLGLMVTFTHTISVFLLGLGTLFLSHYVVPDRIIPVLGTLSGVSIVAVGAWLLYQRIRTIRHESHHHHHHHRHDHGHDHPHYLERDVSLGSLVALGASGGLVPCPSALVLLLSSVALGRVALGLLLLVAFSFGLAIVLVAIGTAVVYTRRLLPDSGSAARHPLFRFIPVASAALILCIGVVMTGISLGWIRSGVPGT